MTFVHVILHMTRHVRDSIGYQVIGGLSVESLRLN